MVTGWTPQRLSRRGRVDLIALRLRRLVRRGEPYRSIPIRTTVAGAAIETFNLDTLSYLVREIFVDACYEMGDMGDHPTIVDVGANIGLASLYFYRRYPRATILAVEADPDVFPLLDRNLRRNLAGAAVSTAHLAAHSGTGSVRLFRQPAKPGRLTNSTDAGRGGPVGVDVPAGPLSQLIEGPVDLLKMDIEGGEHDVVAELAATGALDLVRRIVIEVHTAGEDPDRVDATIGELKRSGFRLRVHDDGSPAEAALVKGIR
jgi:FkbM family methyltransferase